jgi:L-lactate dehydrogenase
MKHTKIAIIGAGAVGTSIAYALILKNIGAEIMLVDINTQRCTGEILDLSDALPFSLCSSIHQGTALDAGKADIIIIAAGMRQGPDQSRTELIDANAQIISSLIRSIQPINQDAIMIMVTNPVDILTLCAQQYSGLPHKQIFGSGTFLDTQRLHGLLAQKLSVAATSIHAYVVGEHGDSQFALWSSAHVGGISLRHFPQCSQHELDLLEQQTQNKAYEIIACKGATYFGIAACVATMCQTINFDQKTVMPLSCYQEKYGIYFSLPAVLGKKGIEQILPIEFDDQEEKKLEHSVQQLRGIIKKCST